MVWRGRRCSSRSESGCLNVVYLLLERHADVEAEDRLGRRPLHLAAQRGHTDVCVALVDSGDADVHAVDHDGNTPLHLAAKANKARTVHQLANIEEHQIREVLSGRLHPGMDREVPLMFSGLTQRPFSLNSYESFRETCVDGVDARDRDAPSMTWSPDGGSPAHATPST